MCLWVEIHISNKALWVKLVWANIQLCFEPCMNAMIYYRTFTKKVLSIASRSNSKYIIENELHVIWDDPKKSSRSTMLLRLMGLINRNINNPSLYDLVLLPLITSLLKVTGGSWDGERISPVWMTAQTAGSSWSSPSVLELCFGEDHWWRAESTRGPQSSTVTSGCGYKTCSCRHLRMTLPVSDLC